MTVKTMNDQLRGDELVLRIIHRMAQGDLPLELIDAAPHTQYLDPDRHRAGVGLLQIIDGPFTAALDLYGALYDARTTHPWNIRIPQTHHGCEQDMKRARVACTGEAANLQDSCIAASEYIHEAFDKAADALNKLGHALTSNEDDEYDKGDFDDEQD